jgi:hypothetical protein
MPTIGKYCKAYPIDKFREFSSWNENKEYPGHEKGEGMHAEEESKYLFLHDNYAVTDGIFVDENIVFDDVSSEWIAFCKEALEFEIPVYELKVKSPSQK